MYFNFHEAKTNQARNFFSAFGFFAVEKLIDDLDFNRLKDRALMVPLERGNINIDNVRHSHFEGAVIEEFSQFETVFFHGRILDIVSSLFGDRFLYLGSDLTFWKDETQPWHRDWLLDLPVAKVGIYLMGAQDLSGGEFRIIPGTQHVRDTYGRIFDSGLAWPDPVTNKSGGLNERSFFPLNPVYSDLASNLQSDFVNYSPGDAAQARGRSVKVLPHVAVKMPDHSDVLFFDNRCIHSATSTIPRSQRVMATALFCPNPLDIDFNLEGIYRTGLPREELAFRLFELLAIDRVFHGHADSYHPKGLRPSLAKKHLVSFVHDPSGFYTGSFGEIAKEFRLETNFYASFPGVGTREKLFNYVKSRYGC